MNNFDSNSHDYLSAEPSSTNSEWMVTFVDLLCLMLVFFILMYATTSVHKHKWQDLKDSLGNSFKPSNVVNKPFEKEIYSTKKDIQREVDIDYLNAIITGKIDSDASLKNKINLEDKNGNLIISISENNLFEGNDTELTKDSINLLFIIGDILQIVNNKIEVVGYSFGDIDNDNMRGWNLSLSRVLEVGSKLREYGNLSQIEVIVTNSDITELENKNARKIEVVISPNII